jgi:glycosyltransferase involved in cell wall biosynthesis
VKPLRKVLICIDWFVPGYKAGGPIQSCANLVAHLQEYYEFYIITRDTDYCETLPYKDVTSDKWNKLDKNINVYYFSSGSLNLQNLSNVIRGVGADTVFINGVYSLYFSILPLLVLKYQRHRNVIISARGMLATSAINVKSQKKKLFLKIGHLFGLYHGIRFHATNENEKSNIQQAISPSSAVVVAPNLPKKSKVISNLEREKRKGELRLFSIARISPEKNTKYALEILERCGNGGKVVLDLYGPIYNNDYWEECKKVINRLSENVVVNYKGSLENGKVAETLTHYHALLLPTRGENFGHIILESLTSGCPVIISDQTPWKNLANLKIGFDLPLKQVEHFVEAIHDFIIMGQEEYNSWSNSAYVYGQRFINDESAIRLNYLMFQ